MKVKDLIEKLSEYLPDLQVCFKETIGQIEVLNQDFEFRMDKFEDKTSKKPYYKLIISPKLDRGKTNWELFKDINPEEDL